VPALIVLREPATISGPVLKLSLNEKSDSFHKPWSTTVGLGVHTQIKKSNKYDAYPDPLDGKLMHWAKKPLKSYLFERNTTMAIDKAHVNEVNQSLGRCFLHSGFLDKFYANFKASHHAIPAYFLKTDMSQQHKLLKEGITFLLMSAGGSSFARNEMVKLGMRHDVDHLNVKPELYRFWLDALMKTVKEYDEKFTADLEKKWRTILQAGIQQMVDTYESSVKSA